MGLHAFINVFAETVLCKGKALPSVVVSLYLPVINKPLKNWEAIFW